MTGKPHCHPCCAVCAKICEVCSGKTALMAVLLVLLLQSEISDQALKLIGHSSQWVHQHPNAVVGCGRCPRSIFTLPAACLQIGCRIVWCEVCVCVSIIYIYIYICICVYVYMYICIYVYMFISLITVYLFLSGGLCRDTCRCEGGKWRGWTASKLLPPLLSLSLVALNFKNYSTSEIQTVTFLEW